MTDLNHIYNYGCVEVENGVMGLAAGNVFDSFGDGDIEEVNAIDFNFGLYNNTFPQLVNYSNLDADLDGVANSVDYLKISNNADMLIRTEAPVTAP